LLTSHKTNLPTSSAKIGSYYEKSKPQTFNDSDCCRLFELSIVKQSKSGKTIVVKALTVEESEIIELMTATVTIWVTLTGAPHFHIYNA
jgi:hypothetical protein